MRLGNLPLLLKWTEIILTKFPNVKKEKKKQLQGNKSKRTSYVYEDLEYVKYVNIVSIYVTKTAEHCILSSVQNEYLYI